MATWSSYRAPLNNNPSMSYSIHNDDDYCYWVSTSGSVNSLIQYDPVADTETAIYNESDYATEFLWDFTTFQDGVYIIASEESTGDPIVYKYDGTPGNWTEVQKLRVGHTAGTFGVIYSNNEFIAAIHVDYQEGVDTIGYHSTDGANWSESYFETLPIMADNYQPLSHTKRSYKYRPIITAFCTTNTGAPDRDCTNTNLMQFNGSGWVDLISGVSDNSELIFLVSPIYNQCWTRELDGVSGLYTEETNDIFTLPSAPNAQIQPVTTTNYGKQFGISSGTTASELYIWNSNNSTDWELLDTISDGVNIASSDYPSMMVFEFDTRDAYFLFYNLDNTRYEIWKRDEPLPPINATLWVGQGTMLEKCELPFQRSMPGAFALRESLGTVVVGSDTPDNEMVAYSNNPYASAIEADTGIPTGTSVSAIRWI